MMNQTDTQPIHFDPEEKFLVSACLAGKCCRYDGKANTHPMIKQWVADGRAIPVCPEQLGGLPTPRVPAEIQKQGDQIKIMTQTKQDVTLAYEKGAAATLAIARQYGCTKAVMKAKSPSCGCGMIYDGSFSHNLIPGDGITVRLLKENGIEVITEDQLP